MKTNRNNSDVKRKLVYSTIIAVLFILLALINTFRNGSMYIDFNPLNGDFQNFNPIRRFLNGQIPFVDFEVYLGMGHLVLGSILTFLFGGDFSASLHAMRMVTFLAFETTILVVFWAVLKNKNNAIGMAIMVTFLNLICFENIIPIDINGLIADNVKEVLMISREPGNSARVIRSSICVISPWLVVSILSLGEQIAKKRNLSEKMKHYGAVGIVSAVAGGSIFWSNDYGFSIAIVMIAITSIVCLKEVLQKKESIKMLLWDVIIILSCFVLMALIGATLVTRGNPFEYIRVTSQVSQYQSWYAVHDPRSKAYYLWDIIIWEPYVFVALGLAITYVIIFVSQKTSIERIKRYLIPASVLFAGFFAVHLYRVSDGGGTEYFWILIFAVIIAETARIFENSVRKESSLKLVYCKTMIVLSIFGGAVIVSSVGEVFTKRMSADLEGVYVNELGGTSKELGYTVLKTKDKLGDSTIFNTYASAMEAVTNQYQPSGVDYIIHVLGDEQRNNYLKIYEECDADYAGVFREEYTSWEGYIRGVNWFYYREMLNNRVISFSNDYQNYYSKSDSKQLKEVDCLIDVEQLQSDNAIITVRFPNVTYNGLADIKVSYNIDKAVRKKNFFCFRQLGHVHDINDPENVHDYYYDVPLPVDKEYVYMPVIIKDGVGQLVITSYPRGGTNLEIKGVESYGLYANALDVYPVTSVDQNGDGKYIITVEGNRIDGYQPFVKIQHENKVVSVLESYTDGDSTEFVIENDADFVDGLDDMAAIKLLNF